MANFPAPIQPHPNRTGLPGSPTELENPVRKTPSAREPLPSPGERSATRPIRQKAC